MRPLASSIITLSLCMGSTIVTYAAEELDTIRSSVWPPPRTETDNSDESHDDDPNPEPPRPDRSKGGPSDSFDLGSDVKETGFYRLVLGATAPFWGPPKLLDDEYDRKGTFFSFPYKRGRQGSMVLEPADPWVISSEIDWGRVGQAGLFHGRLTVGIHYRHVELFSGYDYTDIGKSQMGGLVGGMRFWF